MTDDPPAPESLDPADVIAAMGAKIGELGDELDELGGEIAGLLAELARVRLERDRLAMFAVTDRGRDDRDVRIDWVLERLRFGPLPDPDVAAALAEHDRAHAPHAEPAR